jgi:hypothetical protein
MDGSAGDQLVIAQARRKPTHPVRSPRLTLSILVCFEIATMFEARH